MKIISTKKVIKNERPLLNQKTEDINFVSGILKEDPQDAEKELNSCLEELKLRN